MNSILFVDDEKNILNGIKRVLRPMHHKWSMSFSENAVDALTLLEQNPYDVVICDTRMPDMDGIALLDQVKKRYPDIIRISLSGHADQDLALQSARVTHQHLIKPCKPDKLKETINSALYLRERIKNKELSTIISQAESLPSHPQLYNEIVLVAQSSNGSLEDIAGIISKDIAMSAKILQLVNSAFFGLARHISSVTQAVTLLGVDVIKGLILNIKLFTHYQDCKDARLNLQSHQQQSLQISALARNIAEAQGASKHIADYAQMSGMLHDAGVLVLKANFPEKYLQVAELSANEAVPIWEAERQVFDCSHMDISAYLLGLWGLPGQIIEAVAYHHEPSRLDNQSFSPLTAVHIADCLISELSVANERDAELDIDYIEMLNVSEHVAMWRESLITEGPAAA